MSNISSEASHSTRAKVWFESITLITRSVFAICVTIYVLSLLTGYDDLGQVCLSPAPVVYGWQVYRILTSALFHAGLLHLVFNMMAFVPIGASLERQLGSVAFLWLLCVLCVLGDALYLSVAYLGAYVPINYVQSFRYQCAVGLSGVIFGLVVIDNNISGASTRSIFGFFSVPAKAYPWVLLVVWQLLVPQASFLGHLSGVVMGQLYVWGYLRWALLPAGVLQRVERSALCALCYHRSGFIAHTGGSAAGSGAGEHLLPLARHGHGHGGHAGGPAVGAGRMGSGWLRGVWMPFPANINPLRQQQGAPAGEQQPLLQAPPAVGHTTGGGQALGAGGGSAARPPSDPKAAAAAAAEARRVKAAGGQPSASSSAPNLSNLK